MATFEGKQINDFSLILDEETVTGYENVTPDKLISENPHFFTSVEQAEREVEHLKFTARAYRAWEKNGFAVDKNDDYVL